jgi:hypothetical protein
MTKKQEATASHTPGPWRTHEGNHATLNGDLEARIVFGDRPGMDIAYIPLWPWPNTLDAVVASRADADARLIAAAPTMLAALKQVADLGGFKDSEEYGRAVLAAIAKAVGA